MVVRETADVREGKERGEEEDKQITKSTLSAHSFWRKSKVMFRRERGVSQSLDKMGTIGFRSGMFGVKRYRL
jgi:hypothetical protein